MANSKLASLRKSLEKKGISTKISNPDQWVSTGNYAFNHMMSGRFDVGIPNRRSVLLWGESGTGKSYLLGNIAKNVQDMGYHIIYIDTEDAIHEDYLTKIGVDMDEDNFSPIRLYSIGQVNETMSEIFRTFEQDEKIAVFIDSLSMMETDKQVEDFKKGEMKGDQGQLAKQLKQFMKNVNSKIGDRDMFFVTTAHAYQNQDVLNGEGKWIVSGGKGFQFIPSISVLLTNLKLKEGTDVTGVRIRPEVTKTRFTQTYQKMELEVPYDRGMDQLDGLLDIAESEGLVVKNGGWYSYKDEKGETVKFQKKSFDEHWQNLFDFSGAEEPVEKQAQEEDQ